MKSFTSESVEKLLQSLNNDPRLQALNDTTIPSEEQYPVAFDVADYNNEHSMCCSIIVVGSVCITYSYCCLQVNSYRLLYVRQ